jgi:hypothetical protein
VTSDTESKPKANPNSVLVTMSPLTKRRLEAVAAAEYFGGNEAAVARRFIEDRLRDLLKDGWLREIT